MGKNFIDLPTFKLNLKMNIQGDRLDDYLFIYY